MNYPSIKRIAERLRVDAATAKKIRWAMECPARELPPRDFSENGGRRTQEINRIMGGCGVEYIGDFNSYPCREDFRYINMGDTYDQTVIFRNGRFEVCSWGEIVEKWNY